MTTEPKLLKLVNDFLDTMTNEIKEAMRAHDVTRGAGELPQIISALGYAKRRIHEMVVPLVGLEVVSDLANNLFGMCKTEAWNYTIEEDTATHVHFGCEHTWKTFSETMDGTLKSVKRVKIEEDARYTWYYRIPSSKTPLYIYTYDGTKADWDKHTIKVPALLIDTIRN